MTKGTQRIAEMDTPANLKHYAYTIKKIEKKKNKGRRNTVGDYKRVHFRLDI